MENKIIENLEYTEENIYKDYDKESNQKFKLSLQRDEQGWVKKDETNLKVTIQDHKYRRREVYMPAYLVGLCGGFRMKKDIKLNNNVIVIGETGTGKSSLVQGMAALEMAMDSKKIKWHNIVWDSERFVENYQNPDYKREVLIGDEVIDSVGAINTSKEGKKVKRTVVTGRFQLRTAYWLTDELQEFAYKMVRTCTTLIRVTRKGLKRGFLEVYTDPSKILFIYNGLKYYNKNWRSPEIRKIKPDFRGRFPDYSNIFFNEEEYDLKKMEGIREEDKKQGDKFKLKIVAAIEFLRAKGTPWKEIGTLFGHSSGDTCQQWFSRNK